MKIVMKTVHKTSPLARGCSVRGGVPAGRHYITCSLGDYTNYAHCTSYEVSIHTLDEYNPYYT